jgi:unsaturated rhamnogalacturonyl hydrolase
MLNIIKKIHISLILIFLSLFFMTSSLAASTNEEVLASAKEKGKAVADYLAKSSGVSVSSTDYFDVCSYYGYCLLGEALGDTSFYTTVYNKYKQNKPTIKTGTVDLNSAGILPLYLFKMTKDSSLLKLGKAPADVVISATGNSITEGKTYVRMAIDDTYMVGSLMVQAFRATRDTTYLNFCALYISTYMQNLLQDSTGLYWHKLDSRNYWGRGNGWGAASSTELLQVLPTTHAKYATILDGYKKQMNGLLAVQKTSGMWMQLLDSKDSKNWEESSGTAMFLFAMFTGLKYGWLDKATFLEPAKKGWMALIGYLQNGKLTNVAAGFWPTKKTADEYISAARGQPGDSHGTAAFLWAATAAINYLKNPTSVRLEPNAPRHSINQLLPRSGKNMSYDVLGRAIKMTKSTKNSTAFTSELVIQQGFNSNNKILIFH